MYVLVLKKIEVVTSLFLSFRNGGCGLSEYWVEMLWVYYNLLAELI